MRDHVQPPYREDRDWGDLSTVDTQAIHVPADMRFEVPVPSTIHMNQEPAVDRVLRRLALVLAIACMSVALGFTVAWLTETGPYAVDPSLWNTDTPLLPR